MSKKITKPTYRGYTINASNTLASNTKILDKLIDHTEDMMNTHSKTMLTRFDMHYPQNGTVIPSAKHLEDFNYNLKRKLDREQCVGGHKVDPRIILVQEQHGKSINPHIHGIILTNANAKHKYYTLEKEIEEQWKIATKSDESIVHYCDKKGKNGTIINRNAENHEEALNACIYQASYLAKERGKENKPKGSWLVKGTRLAKKK